MLKVFPSYLPHENVYVSHHSIMFLLGAVSDSFSRPTFHRQATFRIDGGHQTHQSQLLATGVKLLVRAQILVILIIPRSFGGDFGLEKWMFTIPCFFAFFFLVEPSRVIMCLSEKSS